MSQEQDQDKLEQILAKATIEQKKYILAWMKVAPNRSKAAKEAGIPRGLIYRWPNLAEIEEAANILASDAVRAAPIILASAQFSIVELAPDAIKALALALKESGSPRVTAANSILDRAGIMAKSGLDITSGGQALKPITYIEVVRPPDDDDEDA